jgi:hypothetical protein
MGVYPCKHCGALFVSVNMSQQPHAAGCPFSPVTCEPCIVCGKPRADGLVSATVYCGCVDHLNEVRQRKGLPPIGNGTDDEPVGAA